MRGLPPDHEVVGELRRVERVRLVLRTRVNGEDCVTRILLTERLPAGQRALVREVATTGRGSLTGVAESVALTLEGYRVAAQLPGEARFRADGSPLWPRVVAAGLTTDHHVFVTTTWMPGTPVSELDRPGRRAARYTIALDVLEVLRRLHRHGVAHADLKPENIVYEDGRASIIDLDTLRAVPDGVTPVVTRDLSNRWAAPEQKHARETFLASDLWAWGLVVGWLAGDDPLPLAWSRVVRACAVADPLGRPETAAAHRALLGGAADGGPLYDWQGRELPDPGPGGGGPPVLPGVPERIPEAAPSLPVGATERVPEPAPTFPVGATERVPEPAPTFPVGATERVPEPPAGLLSVVPTAPVTAGPAPASERPAAQPEGGRSQRRAGGGCLLFVWWLSIGLGILCLGGLGYGLYDGRLDAAHRTEELEHALRAYKTDPAMNDRSRRPELASLGEPKWFRLETPRSTALGALAQVWAAGWQDAGRAWRPSDQALAEDVLARLQGNHQPEAHLAVATTQAAWCRLRPADLGTAGACAGAVAAVEAFFAAAGDDDADRHWLRVEATWVQVLVVGKLAEDVYVAHRPASEASAIVEPALARCDEAYAWLAHAPVNGPELVEDCLVLAGLGYDLAHYATYASTLLAADAPPLETSTVKRLYTSAGTGCSGVTVKAPGRKTDWAVKGDPWCVAVGHYARGCVDASRDVIARNADGAPTRPWGTLQQALDMLPPLTPCAR